MPDQKVVFYKDFLSRTMSIASKFEFNSDDDAISHIFTLLSSSVELLDNMCVLASNESKIGIPILLRSMLEATVDIQFILNRKDNYKIIEMEDLILWKGIIECAYNGNEYVKYLRNEPLFEEEAKENSEKLKNLKKLGVKKVNISTKFKSKILSDTYESIYAILCSHAHNGKSVQYERHVTNKNKANIINMFKNIPIEKYEYFLHYAVCFLFISMDSINKAFKYGFHGDMNELKDMIGNKEATFPTNL